MIPWFVSDVTPPDFKGTIPSLLSESFFSSKPTDSSDPAAPPPQNDESHGYLRQMVTRWQSYLDSGVFSLSVPQETELGTSDEKVRVV